MSYNNIAKQWHTITGSQGGAFKKYVLNDIILSKIPQIDNYTILELGSGNGYFIPLLLKRFSGQIPNRIVISDQSPALIKIASKKFPIPNAEYLQLDVRDNFPFENDEFDLILTTMMFNELSKGSVFRALKECSRVLKDDGILLVTVLHPSFIESLDKRGLLKQDQKGHFTMPGGKNIRLPVIKRKMCEYSYLFAQSGFQFIIEDIFATKEVLNEKTGLRYSGNCPIAALFICKKKAI